MNERSESQEVHELEGQLRDLRKRFEELRGRL
jgi:hypothetical protein